MSGRRGPAIGDRPRPDRLRFGIFLAPFHKPGINPTLALQQDLELVQWLDRCGDDEAWFGEHHSAGSEISASPEIFIVTAAERTKHIRLGTGVVSLSYHNPLWVAERIAMLDHPTRGRVMLGVGPGALPTDARMIGIDPGQTRQLLEDSLGCIMHLLTSEEPLNFRNDRWDLRDARLHLRPWSNPLFDIATAAVASPLHWGVVEAKARAHGKSVDRARWRRVGLVHIAETMEQAYRDVEYGMEQWFHYFQTVAAFPQMAVPGNNVKEMISFVNDSGFGAIGTPDMCAAQIDRLMKQSNGGFGAYRMLAHNWADPAATHRSYELIARHVMPRFQGHYHPTRDAAARAEKLRPDPAARHARAVEEMGARYAAEVAARAHSGGAGAPDRDPRVAAASRLRRRAKPVLPQGMPRHNAPGAAAATRPPLAGGHAMTRHDPVLTPLQELRANVAAPFAQARAMPKSVYVSPEFAALERDHIFAREWLCAGRAEALPDPGDYLTMTIAGEPVIVLRDGEGRLRALSNVCRHRMSTLLEGRGNVRSIVCPYHAWTYNLDGRLRGAPAMAASEAFCKADIALPQVRCTDWQGWILVTLNPDAPDPADRLAGVEALVGKYAMRNYVEAFREEFDWATNWKVLAENFMESYHLPVCHAATIGPTVDLMKMTCPEGLPAFNYHYIIKNDALDLTLAHPANTTLAGDDRRTTWLLSIYPALLITLSPGYFWYLSLTPDGPGRVHVLFGGGLAPEFVADPQAAAHFARLKALLDEVNAEDKGCVERVYRGLCAGLSAPGPLSHLERPNFDFARYIAAMMP